MLLVRSNYAANVAHRNLMTTDEAVTRSLARLSSGSRVASARDDAASLALGTRLKADVAALEQASQNVAQAGSMLQIAEGGMGNISDLLIRCKTLAVQAASANIGSPERSMLQEEFHQLQDEIDRIANATSFNNHSLLSGTKANREARAIVSTLNGTAPATQIQRISISEPVNPGQKFTVTVNNVPVSYTTTVTDTTVNQVVDRLAAALNTSGSPLLAGITATTDGGSVLLTGQYPGTPFTVTASTSGVADTAQRNLVTVAGTYAASDSIAATLTGVGFKAAGGEFKAGTSIDVKMTANAGAIDIDTSTFAGGATVGDIATVNVTVDGEVHELTLAAAPANAADLATEINAALTADGITTVTAAESLGTVTLTPAGVRLDSVGFSKAATQPTATVLEITGVSDAVAGTASLLSFDIASAVGGNTAKQVAVDVSGNSDGNNLAAVIQAALRSADGGRSDIVVQASGGTLRVTDYAGREIKGLALIDASGQPVGVATAKVAYTSPAAAAAVVQTETYQFLGNERVIQLSDGISTVSRVVETTETVADALTALCKQISDNHLLPSLTISAVGNRLTVTGNADGTPHQKLLVSTGAAHTYDFSAGGPFHLVDTTTSAAITASTAAELTAKAADVFPSLAFRYDAVTSKLTVIGPADGSDAAALSATTKYAAVGEADVTPTTDVAGFTTPPISSTEGCIAVTAVTSGQGMAEGLAAELSRISFLPVNLTTVVGGKFTVGATTPGNGFDLTTETVSAAGTASISDTPVTANLRAATIESVTDRDADKGTGQTTIVSLTGSVFQGNRYTLTVDGGEITYAVADEPDLTAVARNIADRFNRAPNTVFSGVTAVADGDTVKLVSSSIRGAFSARVETVSATDSDPSNQFKMNFQIGINSGQMDSITVTVDSVTADALGVSKERINIRSIDEARKAIGATSGAIDNIAFYRARIGATQNRLATAASNVATQIENSESARSTMMDLDLAREMTRFTSSQVLMQAGVSMLAQANQLPQSLLKLFQ